jgi:hypothetical protein
MIVQITFYNAISKLNKDSFGADGREPVTDFTTCTKSDKYISMLKTWGPYVGYEEIFKVRIILCNQSGFC